jgi:hypothetical protein
MQSPFATAAFVLLCGSQAALAQSLHVLPRPTTALKGSEFVKAVSSLSLAEREERIYTEIVSGNTPDFLRKLRPVEVRSVGEGKTNSATLFVTPDYLAIGSDEDYFLTPMRPETAQRIADASSCLLPTRKLVDTIYAAAKLKLTPSPIPPSPAMTTMEVFAQHNETIRKQRAEHLAAHPLGSLAAGHKKDVVLTPRLADAPGKVAIYGWHRPDGKPIQPLYLGHTSAWVDYSHGVRLVHSAVVVNGKSMNLAEALADAKLASLFSDEGPLASPRYVITTTQSSGAPISDPPRRESASARAGSKAGASSARASFGEHITAFTLERGVRVLINAPAQANFTPGKPVQLVLYALPNGNTTAQTIGRKLQPGDDWHFDIQHIGAQTRWVREVLTNTTLVVAYLENEEKSWPAWRRKHDTNATVFPSIVEAVKGRFKNAQVKFTLSGHSGGGSFIFGYVNRCERIPDDVERITFLDSNYAYDPALGHAEKLAAWLKASDQHFLSVLAYNDAVALLNGKTFVSESGGTWGRSQLMLQDLARHIEFSHEAKGDLHTHTALDGRVKFLLMENPAKVVLHTVQVEKSGFIQSLLSGTPLEGKGYTYFGPRAYERWIAPE